MYKVIGADGREYGPVTGQELRQWIAEGRANARTWVWVEGAAAWRPLVEFAEFAPLLAAAPVPVPIGPPTPLATGPRTNSLAMVGLVMGILALTLGCCCYGVPFNILGVIFSAVALAQIKRDPQNQRGSGQAIAGLILSLFSLVVGALMAIFGTVLNPDVLQRIQKL